MVDLTKISATLNTPLLAAALPQLTPGTTLEARIAQIINGSVLQLISALGTLEIKAAHPSLQPGATVQLTVTDTGTINVRLVSPPANPSSQAVSPLSGNPVDTVTLRQTLPQPPAGYTTTLSPPPSTAVSPPAPTFSILPSVPAQTTAATPIQQNIAANTAHPSPVSTPSTGTAQPASLAGAPAPPSQAAPAVFNAGEIISTALSRQSGFGPLFANAESLLRAPQALPPLLRQALEAVLQTRVNTQNLDATAVQRTLQNSGLFFEHQLANGLANPAQDFKQALLQLVQVLRTLPIAVAAALPKPADEKLPPPQRGGDVTAQKAAAPTVTPATPLATLRSTLEDQAEGALARVRLQQIAAQPETAPDTQTAQQRSPQSWTMDIPLLLNGQTVMMPLTVERDGTRRADKKTGPLWRVKFAIDLQELGAVHALLVMGMNEVGVTLWADRTDTFDLFQSMSGELREALEGEALSVTALDLRAGAPQPARRSAGAFLDTST